MGVGWKPHLFIGGPWHSRVEVASASRIFEVPIAPKMPVVNGTNWRVDAAERVPIDIVYYQKYTFWVPFRGKNGPGGYVSVYALEAPSLGVMYAYAIYLFDLFAAFYEDDEPCVWETVIREEPCSA